MASLGSLGSRRRRAARNGVLGGLGKLTSPTEWTIESGEWPSTVSHAVVNSWTRWNELAAPGSGLKATSTTITPWKVGQVLKLPSAWVPGAAAPAASTTGDYGLPFKVGVKNDTAYKWQYMLNSELGARGIQTVPEDGVFTTKTCDGFGAFARSYKADPDNPTPDDTFAALVVKYQNNIVQACQAMAQPTTTAVVPKPATTSPATPTVSAADLMKQQQTILNTWLVSVGYQPIRVTGVWDAPTCGAGQLMTKTLPDYDPTKIALAKVLAQIKPLVGMPCGVTMDAVTPTRPPVSPPTASQILQMQKLINSEVLRPGGYKLIPEDGKLAAATCGAASDAASAASIGRIKVSATLQTLLNHPGLLPACLPMKPWTFPTAAPQAVVRSSSLPPLNRDGECVVNFGQKFGEIGVLQQQLNEVLAQNGYTPIPITNMWDAATCGAMFELGGKFSPRPSSACPHYYSVPLSCPTVTKPARPVVAPPAPVAKKTNLAVPLGIAALVGVAALVIAKKKGLIMAAKAAAPAV